MLCVKTLRVAPLFLLAAACSCASPSRSAADVAANPNVRELSAAGSDFSFRLLHRLAADQPTGNVFFSPFSLSEALTLTMSGTGGKTHQDMAQTLGLADLTQPQINDANALLLPSLENPDPKVKVSIANALWANQGVTFNSAFQAGAKQFYNAQATTLDLGAPSASETINNWVSRNTRGKITEIVSPETLAGATAVLTDAIYFHGKWQKPFEKADTVLKPFHLAAHRTKTVPLMTQQDYFSYLQTPQFQAVSLPYGAGQISMIVFLPAPKTSLPTFVSGLDSQHLNQWTKAMTPTQMTLFLPRFKADYTATLNAPLSALGMGSAFSPGANFEPMGFKETLISKVIHEAVLQVDEEGTVASAATGVVTTITALAAPPETTMRVDRPFFCVIRDTDTGTILFEGVIRDPQ